MFVAKNQFRIRASNDFSRDKRSTEISLPILSLLQKLEVQICPYSNAYSVAVVKDLQGIWMCDIKSHLAFHLPTNHFNFWSNWLSSLSTYQDKDGLLRCNDLGTLIKRLQKWS